MRTNLIAIAFLFAAPAAAVPSNFGSTLTANAHAAKPAPPGPPAAPAVIQAAVQSWLDTVVAPAATAAASKGATRVCLRPERYAQLRDCNTTVKDVTARVAALATAAGISTAQETFGHRVCFSWAN